MFRGRTDDWSPEGTPFYKQRAWMLSAVFMGLVVVMSLIVYLTTGDDGRTEVSGTVVPKARDGRPEGCRTDDKDTRIPAKAPTDVEWRQVDIAKVPMSETAGPLLSTGSLRWCFARTPMGAVMAAHLIPSYMSGPDWRAAAERQVFDNPARRLFLAFREGVAENGVTGRTAALYAGFSVRGFTKGSATVELLIKNSQAYASTVIELRWDEGDWKVVPQPDGTLHTSVTSTSGTSGFILWGT